MTVSASCVCGRPNASTYSTPRARPSPSVRTRVTRQCVRRSKLPGGQRFPHARQPRMPFVAGPGAKAIVPGGVGHLGVAVVRSSSHADRRRMRMEPQALRRRDEHLTHPKWTCRREWVRRIMRQKRVVFVAADAGDPFDLVEIRSQLVVGDRPVDDRAPVRDCRRPPALQRVRPQPEVVGGEPAQPAAIVDDRSADAVHHPAQREGELPRWLRFVPPPARRLALELCDPSPPGSSRSLPARPAGSPPVASTDRPPARRLSVRLPPAMAR